MTDETIIAIVGAIVGAGGLGGALKWGVGRIVRSNDAGTEALVNIAASNAVLVTKIDELREELREVADFVRRHVTIAPPSKTKTPVRGNPIPGMYGRPKTRGGTGNEDT